MILATIIFEKLQKLSKMIVIEQRMKIKTMTVPVQFKPMKNYKNVCKCVYVVTWTYKKCMCVETMVTFSDLKVHDKYFESKTYPMQYVVCVVC